MESDLIMQTWYSSPKVRTFGQKFLCVATLQRSNLYLRAVVHNQRPRVSYTIL